MIRRPLRPLARILKARANGEDPDRIEAEARAARLVERHRAERQKAETRLLLLGLVFVLGFTTVAGRMALLSAAVPVEPRAEGEAEPIRKAAHQLKGSAATVAAVLVARTALQLETCAAEGRVADALSAVDELRRHAHNCVEDLPRVRSMLIKPAA